MLRQRNRIILWLGGSLALYIVFALWFPLLPYANHAPTYDVRSFSPSLSTGLLYALLLLLLFGFYRQAVHTASRLTPAGILALTLLLALPLLFTYPINATDLYRYLIRGRVLSTYGTSPFAAPPTAFPDDPFLPLAGEWAGETSPYGPLWELIAGGVTAVTGENLLAGLLSFKLLALAAHLAITLLIYRWGSDTPPETRRRRSLLWAWNPALLLMFIIDGHNDVLMLLWLVLGAFVIRRGRWTAGMLLLTIAALTKPIALLPLPIFFVAGWQAQPALNSRLRFAAGTFLGGTLLGLSAFAPFGSPGDLAVRLLREASLNPGFSPATLILLAASRLGVPISFDLLGNVLRLALGLVVIWLLWRTWHGRSPLRGAADIFAAYILQAFSFRLWYLIWPFPLLLLDPTPGSKTDQRLQTALWALLNVQLSVVIYGHIFRYALGGDHFWSHLIAVPFVFILPFLLARQKSWRW